MSWSLRPRWATQKSSNLKKKIQFEFVKKAVGMKWRKRKMCACQYMYVCDSDGGPQIPYHKNTFVVDYVGQALPTLLTVCSELAFSIDVMLKKGLGVKWAGNRGHSNPEVLRDTHLPL